MKFLLVLVLVFNSYIFIIIVLKLILYCLFNKVFLLFIISLVICIVILYSCLSVYANGTAIPYSRLIG